MRRETPSDLLKRCVLRVTLAEDATETFGTAFALTDELALTCAHVVPEGTDKGLVLQTRTGECPITEVLRHPEQQAVDLAILRTERPLTDVPAASDGAVHPTRLISRGYLKGDQFGKSSEFHFTPRGQTDVTYAGPDAEYHIEDAFEFVGDVQGGAAAVHQSSTRTAGQ